jgi:hypothetical protein
MGGEMSEKGSDELTDPAARKYSRRVAITELARFVALAPFAQSLILAKYSESHPFPFSEIPVAENVPFTSADEALLDEIEQAGFRFFWEQADSKTGLVKDRSLAGGSDYRDVASIAATGFGLTALTIADQRGWENSDALKERARATLRFLTKSVPQAHGFLFHFMHMPTGDRAFDSEVSTIDTSLLLCGVLSCRAHFDDNEIRTLATEFYERVDWPWFLNGGNALSMGWKPESGFLTARWNHYCELMMIYLLGLGSPTHPLPAKAWDAWTRPVVEYQGLKYISAGDPLFVHQYSQAWFDFRNKRDRYADYFENSIIATRAHKLFCSSLSGRFPDYGEDLWGITSSDSAHGYVAWGGPPSIGPIDGSIVPCAAGGSLAFLSQDAIRVLHTMRDRFGKQAWKRYGFVDAFNPLKGWYDPDVIGIDLGITLLMAENARTGFVWDTFMKDADVQRGMSRAGFHAANPETRAKSALPNFSGARSERELVASE